MRGRALCLLLSAMLWVQPAVSDGAAYYVTEEQMQELTLQLNRQRERLSQLESLSESLEAQSETLRKQSERLSAELEESRTSLSRSRTSGFRTGLLVGVTVGVAVGGLAVFAIMRGTAR